MTLVTINRGPSLIMMAIVAMIIQAIIAVGRAVQKELCRASVANFGLVCPGST